MKGIRDESTIIPFRTYGNTPACINLDKTLNQEENKKFRRIISTLISNYFKNTNIITTIRNKTTRNLCLLYLKNDFIKRIDDIKNVNSIILSHTKNIIITKYRIAIKV